MSDISEEYLSNIYKDVIMDHFRNPRNSVEIEEYDHARQEINPFCGDKVEFRVKLSSNRVITNVSATAEGCTVIKAASSMLSVYVQDKDVDRLPFQMDIFEKFLKNEEDTDYSELSTLADLRVVRQHPVRLKCVLLPVRALLNLIEGTH